MEPPPAPGVPDYPTSEPISEPAPTIPPDSGLHHPSNNYSPLPSTSFPTSKALSLSIKGSSAWLPANVMPPRLASPRCHERSPPTTLCFERPTSTLLSPSSLLTGVDETAFRIHRQRILHRRWIPHREWIPHPQHRAPASTMMTCPTTTTALGGKRGRGFVERLTTSRSFSPCRFALPVTFQAWLTNARQDAPMSVPGGIAQSGSTVTDEQLKKAVEQVLPHTIKRSLP